MRWGVAHPLPCSSRGAPGGVRSQIPQGGGLLGQKEHVGPPSALGRPVGGVREVPASSAGAHVPSRCSAPPARAAPHTSGAVGSESRGRRGPARARPWVLPSVARPPWAVRTPLPTRLRLRPGQAAVLLTRRPVAFSWRRRRVLGAFSPRAESGSASAGRHTPWGPCPPRTLAFLSVARAFWLSLVGFFKEMQVSTVVTLIAQDEWTHLA